MSSFHSFYLFVDVLGAVDVVVAQVVLDFSQARLVEVELGSAQTGWTDGKAPRFGVQRGHQRRDGKRKHSMNIYDIDAKV